MSLVDLPKPHAYPSIEKAIKDDGKRFGFLGLVQYEGTVQFAEWHCYGGGMYVPVLRPWRIDQLEYLKCRK